MYARLCVQNGCAFKKIISKKEIITMKTKKIISALLLLAVISVGFSAIICAESRNGYVSCFEAYDIFVPDRIPYIEVYARYLGYNMNSPFRAVVGLNYNNSGWNIVNGNISYQDSEACLIHRPAYGSDPYVANQYCEIFD